ncbi:MAG TPA: AAA family ATPase [Terracidiphilus sp.]|nr:AAA family ATPase [Terracidiphilus sp.]
MAAVLPMQEFVRSISRSEPGSPAHRPRALQELGIRQSIVEDLALKTLYLSGTLSVLELGRKLGLGYEIMEDLVARLRAEMLCQVAGMTGNVPLICVSDKGRTKAGELMAQNSYTGAAPVSFENYIAQTRIQSSQKVAVHAEDIHRAFKHLVIEPDMLTRFGTALNSGSSVLLYGPAGTGKTTIAEVLSRVMADDPVWIPYAIEIDGQIVTIWDRAIHKPHTAEGAAADHDARWVRCERPAVMVGGELTGEMLDLQYNPVTKFYQSPIQMKANNGVLIIDDFGRQRIRPEELMNRWIVPLDRRIDFLNLSGGKKIEMPFEMLVVFASNKEPSELVDPAFLRRIQTKIRIGSVNEEQFAEIFRRVAAELQVEYETDIPYLLSSFIQDKMKQDLRSCYPRDIVNQVCWSASYDGVKPFIDRQALLRAIEAYFTS